jgi:phospholipid transport system substrate-binding protein
MPFPNSRARAAGLTVVWLITGLLLLTVAAPARPADPEAARQLVEDTTYRLLKVLENERERLKREPGRIYYLVNGILLPHFDFRQIARWVLGKYWRTATGGQRERFTEEFRTLMVRTYATALLEYTDQKVRVLPIPPGGDTDRVTVRTEVRQPGGGPPLDISYVMYARDGIWKVYDVVIDGISLVSNYRTAFSTQIEREGLEKLITRLAERTREVAGE